MLLALFALPVLITLGPPTPEPARALSHIQLTRAVPHISPVPPTPATSRPSAKPLRVILILPPISLFVTFLLLARLAYNLLQLRSLTARSQSISDPLFRETVQDLWLRSGATPKPRVAVSHEICVPVTFTAAENVWILLPPAWTNWDATKLNAVLTHELAHIQRADSASLTLASFATCIFWFHPLSWFLQHELARLAEEACDEIVLSQTNATPDQYANLLIGFAQDVQKQQGRLALTATAVVRKPNMQKRMERLFTQTRPIQRWLRPAFLALFIGTLYLTAAARLNDPPSPHTEQTWPDWQRFSSLSPSQIANLQSAVEANPEDLSSRMELIVYFAHTAHDHAFTQQMLWFIEHHPSFKGLPYAAVFPFDRPLSETSHDKLRDAWEEAVATHPDEVAVVLNAASFIEGSDQLRALALLHKAETLGVPAKAIGYGMIYAAAEMQALNSGLLNNMHLSTETGAALRADLAASRDPQLLTETGRTLAELDYPLGNHAQRNRGLELIHQAVLLDPTNPEWKHALELNDLYQAMLPDEHIQLSSGVILSPAEAEASLVTKANPIYPPKALAAHIQGIVEFTVTVGTDGTVSQLQLVCGDPVLVDAAKDAVLKSVYHQATQAGKPIPFVTEVMVSFNLPN